MTNTVVLLVDDTEQTLRILPLILKRLRKIAPFINRIELVYLFSTGNEFIKRFLDDCVIDVCYRLKIDSDSTNFQQLTKEMYELISDKKIELILSSNSPICKECMAGLAYLFNTGLAADCNGLTYDEVKKKFCFERLIGDYPPQIASIIINNSFPQMATFMDMVRGDKALDFLMPKKETIIIDIVHRSNGIKKKIKEDFSIQSAFAQYKVFFIVGAGVDSFEHAEKLRKFSKKKKIGFGVTRQIINKGWYDDSYLIGISGKKISPNVCVAFGVSGTYQHYIGIRDSKYIISINNDISASMVNYAHKTIVADANSVIDGLTNNK